MSPQAAAAFASLQTQVFNIESEFNSAVSRIETTLNSLNAKIEARSTTNWGVIASWAGIVLLLGGALYYPINKDTASVVAAVSRLQDVIVPRVEHQKEWERAEKSLLETRTRIEKNQETLIPRDVFMSTTTALQRQIDEIRRDVGGVVTTRDVLQNTEKKLDRLESEFRDSLRRPRD